MEPALSEVEWESLFDLAFALVNSAARAYKHFGIEAPRRQQGLF